MALRFDLCASFACPWGPLSDDTMFPANNKTLAVDYTYVTAGDAQSWIVRMPVTANITDVYVFINATTTAGDLIFEIRNWNPADPRPGSTLHYTETLTPGSLTNQWIKVNLDTPLAVTINTAYCFILGSGAGLSVYEVIQYPISDPVALTGKGSDTADGWTTAAAEDRAPGPIVIVLDDGTIFGAPYTTYDASFFIASNTVYRGLRLAALDVAMEIRGVMFDGTGSASLHNIAIFEGTTGPGGTPVHTGTALPASGGSLQQHRFAPFTLQAGTTYRIVAKPTAPGTANGPGVFTIEDDVADLRAAMVAQGNWYATVDNGAGGWTDHTDSTPLFIPILSVVGGTQPPAASADQFSINWLIKT